MVGARYDLCVLNLLKDQAHIDQEKGTCIRQLYAARLTAKELYVWFGFKRPDLLTQRKRLGDPPYLTALFSAKVPVR